MDKKPKLIKDVCKHCMSVVNTTGGPPDWVDKYGHNRIIPWNDVDPTDPYYKNPRSDFADKLDKSPHDQVNDEKKWQEGKVVCPYWGSERSIYEIPEWCTFKFEHMMMGQDIE